MTNYIVRSVLVTALAVAGFIGCAGETESLGSFEQAAAVLPPVTNLQASGVTTTQATLTWDAVPGATLYIILRGTAPGNETTYTTAPPVASFQEDHLTPGSTYSYQVLVVIGNDWSTPSNEVLITTLGAQTLQPPANVVATATSSSRITLSWTPVMNALGYYIYQSDAGGPFNYIGTAPPADSSRSIAGLTSATTYSFYLQSVFIDGISAPSAIVSATTFGTPAGVVEGHWNFDEQMGTIANDISGFNRTGTLTGAVSFVNDKFYIHDSLSALASSGGSVTVPPAPGFDLYTDFTVSLWAKVGAGAAVHFVGVRDAGCGAGWDIAQDGANQLHFRGSSTDVLSFGQSLPADTWTHIAVTSTSGTLQLYLGGVPVASGALAVAPHLANPLQIGNAGGCTQNGAFVVDDVAILSRVMSAGEIATIGTPPPAPTNLVATVVSSTQVDLAWDPVPNADLYIIYRGTGPGTSQFFTTWPGTNPTFDYNHLEPGTQYSWQVRSVRNNLRSNFSNEQVVTTSAPPTAPSNVVAMPGSPTRLNVTWTTVAGATYHYIFVSVNGGAFSYLTTTYATPAFEAAGLTTGSTYSYKIQAITPGGISAESAPSTPVAAP
ncbi:MAG: cell wall-binding protein [Deltaproteobacteria bacterium]|nr:cell wall-binding protein [Deltaproteobacteria bacterium]